MLMADAFVRSGKVRDLYELPDGRLLLVASDRMSAFDVILPTDIPDKGRVLTGLSRFWFAETDLIVPNHLLDADVAVLRDAVETGIENAEDRPAGPSLTDDLAILRGRIMICQPALVVPIEAVVRGYLTGSGWREYQASGTVCGIPLPPGLREADQLPEPIFTPATKAELGEHDENVTFETVAATVGAQLAAELRDCTLEVYRVAAEHAAGRGIILADTKFEFGVRDGLLVLADEVLTPDSSRFWPADGYRTGRVQPSYDKQFVRDWLTGPESGWDRRGELPPPPLPAEIVNATRERYVSAYEQLSGLSFADWIG
jgi:phosphoribosylaminoimidazole-succinocarboxamide synthase